MNRLSDNPSAFLCVENKIKRGMFVWLYLVFLSSLICDLNTLLKVIHTIGNS